MQIRDTHKKSSALRSALSVTWDLNLRAIPTALVWAVSLLFLFQTSSLLTRLGCSVVCSVISLFNSTVVKFSHKRIKPVELIKSPEFQKVALLNVFVGILFVIALSNMLDFQPASLLISVALKSSALTLLIGWMGLMLVVNPLFVSKVSHQEAESIAEIFMLYVKHSKKEVLLTGAIVVVCAPLIFIFISIVLTLTQAITITTFEAMRETEI